MSSSAVGTFADPDEFTASVRGTRIELTLPERGHFAAKLIRIDLHRLWMQRSSVNLPWIVHSAHVTDRAIFTFRTQAGPSVSIGGMEYLPSNVIRHGEGQSFYHRSSGPHSIGAMSLPVADAVAVGVAIAGCDLRPPKDPQILTPAPWAMARLQQLHAQAGRMAEQAPETIAIPEVARALEQSLIKVMVACLRTGAVREDRAALRRHRTIMRRFYEMLEATSDRALYLADICATVGVTERTLQRCCHEQFGIGPHRFLLLRRMHLARQGLREADADTTNVTQIATQLGFWELGRFAAQYKALFGESPSVTLLRPPDHFKQPAVGIPRILAGIA